MQFLKASIILYCAVGGTSKTSGHGTYKQGPKMNLITQYGTAWISTRVRVSIRVRVDFILQNLAPPVIRILEK